MNYFFSQLFSDFLDFLKLSRFQFLIGGFLIFLLGALVSFPEELFSLNFYLILLCCLVSQLSVSFSNDFFDYKFDANGKKSLISGGSGVLIKNKKLVKFSKYFSIFLIFVSILLAFFSVILFGVNWIFFVFVILASFFGWFYSAPPLRLSYSKKGELVTAFVVGLLLPLSGSIAVSNELSINTLLIIPALILYSGYFSFFVQSPDYETDLKSKKNNFTYRNGTKTSAVYSFLFSIYASLYLLALNLFLSGFFGALFWFSLIPVISSGTAFLLKEKKELVPLYSTINIFALFLFIGLCDLYLFIGFI